MSLPTAGKSVSNNFTRIVSLNKYKLLLDPVNSKRLCSSQIDILNSLESEYDALDKLVKTYHRVSKCIYFFDSIAVKRTDWESSLPLVKKFCENTSTSGASDKREPFFDNLLENGNRFGSIQKKFLRSLYRINAELSKATGYSKDFLSQNKDPLVEKNIKNFIKSIKPFSKDFKSLEESEVNCMQTGDRNLGDEFVTDNLLNAIKNIFTCFNENNSNTVGDAQKLIPNFLQLPEVQEVVGDVQVTSSGGVSRTAVYKEPGQGPQLIVKVAKEQAGQNKSSTTVRISANVPLLNESLNSRVTKSQSASAVSGTSSKRERNVSVNTQRLLGPPSEET